MHEVVEVGLGETEGTCWGTLPPHAASLAPLQLSLLMLLRISQASAHAKLFAHTSSSGRSPRPRQGLAPCLGPSPGHWAAVRGGRPSVLQYLFIYLFEGPAFTQTGSDSLGAGRRGTLLPGPLMCERRDGEMVLGAAAALGCVCAWGEPR